MRNTTKRIIALVLVAFMVAACMAVGVSAAEPKVTVNVLTGSVEVSADALAKLADGNRAADATAFSDANLVGFKNTGFTHTDGVDAAVEATVEIIADLGEEKVSFRRLSRLLQGFQLHDCSPLRPLLCLC